jgi:hypothetical protein
MQLYINELNEIKMFCSMRILYMMKVAVTAIHNVLFYLSDIIIYILTDIKILYVH